MSEVRNIPKHWQIKTLGEVCKLQNGYAFKSDLYEAEGVPVIRISDINGGIVSSGKSVRVKPIDEYENYVVGKNDILVAMSGATTGKFGIYKSSEKAYQNQRVGKFKILDKDILDNEFLYHQINFLKRQIEKDAYGGAQPNISSNKIEQMQIVVPPLPEQQLIVSKIEELLSDLDNGKQQLLTAQQQLKVYRQSLLKWAFEGKLTNKNIKNGELPKEWKWVNSGDLFAFVTSGSRGWAKYYSQSGSIFIRITNMDFDTLKLDLKESKIQYVNPPSNSEGIRTKVQEGDFLFSITGYLGMFAIAPKLESAYVNQHVCLCRPKVGFNKKYVGYWIISKSGGHHHLNKNQKGAVKAGLNLDDLKSFPVPLASLEEQQLIVDQLESKLTVCDKIEETISQSLLQAETLRQSILKKAFEGKLVCLNYDSDDKLDKHEMGLAAEKQVPYKTSS